MFTIESIHRADHPDAADDSIKALATIIIDEKILYAGIQVIQEAPDKPVEVRIPDYSHPEYPVTFAIIDCDLKRDVENGVRRAYSGLVGDVATKAHQ